jgi:hypothetical protein
MTPQDHNKIIGIMHIIYGGGNALLMMIFLPFIVAIAFAGASDPQAGAPFAAVFGIFGVFVLLLALVFGLPPILAGYAMLKRKSWAKVMGVIASCVEALSMPFGTALCVYTLWFLFSGQGEHLYRAGGFEPAQGRGAPHLRGAESFNWEAQRARQAPRPGEYVPPPQPPDWRGQ